MKENKELIQENKKIVTPFTRLSGKEYSPLIIRRYSVPVLHFIAVISDDNLDTLDEVARACWVDESGNERRPIGIQDVRNFAGEMTERVANAFPKTEGVAVIIEWDKMSCASLFGDFMNHEMARLELYTLISISTQV